MLIGNKCRAPVKEQTDCVSFEEADRFAVEYGISLFEADAITGENVPEAVGELLMKIRDKMDIGPMDVDFVEFGKREMNNNSGASDGESWGKKHNRADGLFSAGAEGKTRKFCNGWFCL